MLLMLELSNLALNMAASAARKLSVMYTVELTCGHMRQALTLKGKPVSEDQRMGADHAVPACRAGGPRAEALC
eukprot:gene3591-4520_t